MGGGLKACGGTERRRVERNILRCTAMERLPLWGDFGCAVSRCANSCCTRRTYCA